MLSPACCKMSTGDGEDDNHGDANDHKRAFVDKSEGSEHNDTHETYIIPPKKTQCFAISFNM